MKLLKSMVLMLALASLAAAMPIVGLYSTGLTSDGSALGTLGGAESSWLLNGSTAYITQTGQYPFPNWGANDSNSQWISAQPAYGGGATDAASTTFSYTLSFDLTGYDPGTASFSYRVAGDNYVESITLNGNSISGANLPSDLGTLGSIYTASSGFVAGLNTITVLVPNSAGDSGNPTGFRMEITESNVSVGGAVPEPATFALVGLALAAIPVIRRRRRS